MKKANILMALIATAMPAYAQDTNDQEIVVTGKSLKDTERDLLECIARKCRPDEDMRATLAHAENQFVKGDYKSARGTLQKSLGRNRQYRGQYPVELSDMLRADANIADHLGEEKDNWLAILEMRDTLKDNLSADDKRILGVELEVGDAWLKRGKIDEAKRKYRDVEKRATTLKLANVAAIARLRELSMLVYLAQADKKSWRTREARKEIEAYIAKPTPGAEQYVMIAEILKSRLDRAAGDMKSTEALIARQAALNGAARPILIHSEPIEMNPADVERMNASGNAAHRAQMNAVEKRWVDIGFWVNGDGQVEDLEILRSEGNTDWADVVLKALRKRLYTKTAISSTGAPGGLYMVERYTFTANWTDDTTGTRLRQRSGIPKIERIDLTT